MKTAPTIEGSIPSIEEKRATLEALNGAEGIQALNGEFDAFDAELGNLKNFGPLREGRHVLGTYPEKKQPGALSTVFEQRWGVDVRTGKFLEPVVVGWDGGDPLYDRKYSINAHTARKLFLFSTVVPVVVKWISQAKDAPAKEALKAQLKALVEERITAKDPRKAAQAKLQQWEKDHRVYFTYDQRSGVRGDDTKRRAEDQRQVAEMEADRSEMDQELDRLLDDAMKPIMAIAWGTNASVKGVAEA